MLQQSDMTPEHNGFSNAKFHGASSILGAELDQSYHRATKAQSPAIGPGRTAVAPQDENAAQVTSFSDTHLASRKANETAGRRFQAAAWLQAMVGPLDLPMEPSEEELRLCLRNGLVLCNLMNKIHPGAVSKIVENPTLSCPPPEGAALSAYQYFENVRNFLVAVEDLKLPSFEASDLEKGSLQAGLLAKVVDCILSLKAYHEWQQAGGHGFWKFGAPIKYPVKQSNGFTSNRFAESVSHSAKANGQSKCLGADEYWGLFGKGENFDGLWKGHESDFMEECENAWSNFDSNSAVWVQHVCQKFVDVFLARNKSSHETNMPCEQLLKLVMIVLDDRQIEELPMLLEFMLKKVIEECEQRLGHRPDGQLKRSHSKIVEDFAALQDCSDQQDKVQALLRELRKMQTVDQQRAHWLELQANELKELRSALETSRFDIQDLQCGWEKELQALNVRLQGLAQAATEYHKVAAENRELYNQVQDLKGNIRVYCRVRPFLPGQNSSHSTVDYIGDKGSIVIANPVKQGKEQRKAFTFNKVFGPLAAQEEVFLDTQPLIRSVLDGFNVCIFAYGQTGSGKTYTMTGPNRPSPKDWGVNFRALHDLFQISVSRHDLVKYEVGVQMIEIYNEQVRDLLCPDGSNKKLEIRNSSQQNGLNVPDASMVSVNSTEDVLQLMNTGHRNRAVGSTALNERSSRSHSVLTVHVKGTDLSSGAVLRGCLHLVDLAGSERVDKSEATGDRLKEAQHINKSLSALGDVIAALAQKNSHVPYRNSKLTQLLQDSLGGQAKTLMFVHISPDYDSHGETISTLKFAERVAAVELGAAQSNKESGEVRDLKDQIAFLKDALSKKDGELERLHKEPRGKSNESAHEKPKVKSATHGHGPSNYRTPLEEVRNVETRQSPNMNRGNGDHRAGSFSRPLSPNGHGASSRGFYGFHEEEDLVKRRTTKLLRQPTSPDSRSSNSNSNSNSELSYHMSSPPMQGINNAVSNKNKIRHGSPDDRDQRALLRHDRLSDSSRHFTVQSSTPNHQHHHHHQYGNEMESCCESDGRTETAGPLRLQNGHVKHAAVERKKDSSKVPPLSVHNQHHTPPPTLIPYPPGAQQSLMRSQVKRAFQLSAKDPDSGEYSTEESTGRLEDFEEEGETSDYSEAELWHKDPDAGVSLGHGNGDFLSNGGRSQQETGRRYIVSSPQQPLKKERKAGNAATPSSSDGGADGQRVHRRTLSYSVAGSTPFGIDPKRVAGKSTLEAKLIAAPADGGNVEHHMEKASHPRQSPQHHQQAPSRRWH